MSNQLEIRQRVTQQIIAALEQGGTPPWKRPWSAGGMPRNAATSSKYSGINPAILNISAMSHGWSGVYWATYQQWRGLGCQVRSRPNNTRPGEWGTKIVFCRPVEKTTKTDDGDKDERYWVLKEYVVFAAEQVEGAVAERLLSPPDNEDRVPDFWPAEDVLRSSGADIRYGGDRAYYSPVEDYVRLPYRSAFGTSAAYYSTAMHELCHWTGHQSRLDRLAKTARFGSESYAFEELCAEIGSTYLCTELNVPQSDDLSNTTAYLASWLRVLKSDPGAIFKAAAMGSKAADYLLYGPAKVGDEAPALAA